MQTFKTSLAFFFLLTVCFPTFCQNARAVKQLVPGISKSDRTEFSPTISADGKRVIFESQNGDKWELYQSHQEANGQWAEPVPLDAINAKCNFIAGPSLSYDANTLYYTAFIEEVTQSEDIFYSVRLDEAQWSDPQPIGAPINTEDGYEGFPSIASDGLSLYFIRINPEKDRDKKSKEPCFAIYVSHRQTDGTWGEPIALPAPVNSGCERDPRIMADNRTLIFSSIREGGKGKYDLYQSRLQQDGTWTDPIALDYVNSPDNDQSPCISASGDLMYYYSNDDIYATAIPETYRQLINVTVSGTVVALADQAPLKTTIHVVNSETRERFISESNANGSYSVVLAAGNAYEITFFSAGFLPEKISADYSSTQTYREETLNVKLNNQFSLLTDIRDADLPNLPVKAFLSIRSAGESVYADSLTTNSATSIPLLAGTNYVFEASAPGYEAMKQEITFGGDTLTSEVRKTFTLVHEKVAVVADVTDISTGSRKRMKVSYNNESTDEVIIADAGEVVNLRKGDRYQVITNSDKGYAYALKTITAGEGGEGEEGPVNVPLSVAALLAGSKLTLNHIYFETNSAALSESSALELKTIIQLLLKNPGVTIEISAHTDNVGSDDYNLTLSQKRATSVTDYLSRNGIPKAQLVARGYGKTAPVVPNDSDENRAKNRRVELLVLKAE